MSKLSSWSPLVLGTRAEPGTEPPTITDEPPEAASVPRTFGFVDISGFTAFCDQHGEHAAIELLTEFRSLARGITSRRATRIAKWLGDGVMLVATEQNPLLATVAELTVRSNALGIPTHAGIASGEVLMFEGDDYVGRTVNLAARLCDAAEVHQILAADLATSFPKWIEPQAPVSINAPGLGLITKVRPLQVRPEIVEVLSPPRAG
ncbi:MAG: adenylate/guanylate cyclase domain-containing protein [Actinobacteria bacterium]|nr:adenylate/guanylate cyclase domain-containing protein [Actinomycetota bacterium]